jgi:Sec-independent protein translocase protein TatA
MEFFREFFRNTIDIHYIEIMVILLVILIVVGPDNLLKYAHKLGRMISNFRK